MILIAEVTSNSVVLQGYLKKLAPTMRTWQRRWFWVANYRLYYCREREGEESAQRRMGVWRDESAELVHCASCLLITFSRVVCFL
jgi:hypothetical protein